MAWTTPGTVTAGDVLTAALWNANVRDNMNTTYNYGNVAYFRDEQTSGTNGGTFTSGSFVTRVLNSTVVNTISGCTLTSNQVSLPAGTYWIIGNAPALNCDSHRALIYNVTDSATALLGASGSLSTSATVNDGSIAIVQGPITIASTKTISLRHRCQTTRATNGLGLAASFSETEIYAQLWIWKVS
jgi:hypothetical protein